MVRRLIGSILLFQAMAFGQAVDIPTLVVLGTVQDGGAPHMACSKTCCIGLTDEEKANRKVTALGLQMGEDYVLFEATPDIVAQTQWMQQGGATQLQGIFLTHAHIGHYTGLMYLGKEAWGAKHIPVYAMERMYRFLEQNGPWSQLVAEQNIELLPLADAVPIRINPKLYVTPMQVPHRDEFSETVGYKIEGPHKKALFIPDIDKWQRWSKSLIAELAQVDYALIDATFFDAAEINYRPIEQIPHPFVIETLELLQDLPAAEKAKVFFIHINHTNPLLNPQSAASKKVETLGFHIARLGDSFSL
jgi:pyrroloquinoline quinone biosynthesis protein B